MFVYNTIKGELCLVECWMDEDYSERYEDGGRDLIWIDRHHTNEFGDIENYMSQKFADISDTIWIEVHALRSTEVTRYFIYPLHNHRQLPPEHQNQSLLPKCVGSIL